METAISALMTIQESDIKRILYDLARFILTNVTDLVDFDQLEDLPSGMKRQLKLEAKGSIRYAELMLQALDRERVSLDDLVRLSKQSVRQVKEEASSSHEHLGAFRAFGNVLVFVKGAKDALSHAILRAYSKI